MAKPALPPLSGSVITVAKAPAHAMKFTRIVTAFSLGVCTPLLLGACASSTLHSPFQNFNRAYAATLNEQMLLNLARLHNGHPPYYLVVGTINNKYEFGGDVGAGGTRAETDTDTFVRNSSTVNNTGFGMSQGVFGLLTRSMSNTVGATATTVANAVTTGNASAGLSALNKPEFQFIPLNNSDVAKQFLEPISIQVFASLYQQGYPIDILMRVLVERAELITDDSSLVLVNAPAYGERLKQYRGTEVTSSYAMFLRASDMLRELQLEGHLSLDYSSQSTVVSYTTDVPKADDLLKAHQNGLSYRRDEASKHWQLIKDSSNARFYIRPDREVRCRKHLVDECKFDRGAVEDLLNLLVDEVRSGASASKTGQESMADHPPSPEAMVSQLLPPLTTAASQKPGMVILSQAAATSEEERTSQRAGNRAGYKASINLRSYSRALDAVASEQDGFYKLESTGRLEIVREEERRPILRTVWKGDQKTLPPLLTVRYSGKTYAITDPVPDPNAVHEPSISQQRWNRDVFKLLVALASQVSVDIAKYQRSVIELQ